MGLTFFSLFFWGTKEGGERSMRKNMQGFKYINIYTHTLVHMFIFSNIYIYNLIYIYIYVYMFYMHAKVHDFHIGMHVNQNCCS